jgi:hypothetical protein
MDDGLVTVVEQHDDDEQHIMLFNNCYEFQSRLKYSLRDRPTSHDVTISVKWFISQPACT